jgi:hypothetical protein
MSSDKRETIEEFLARGGEKQVCKPYMPKQKVVLRTKHFDRRVANDFLVEKEPRQPKQKAAPSIESLNLSLIPEDLLDKLAEEGDYE